RRGRVPRRFAAPARRGAARGAAAARTARGHPAAGPAFPRRGHRPARPAAEAAGEHRARGPGPAPLARQRARAREPLLAAGGAGTGQRGAPRRSAGGAAQRPTGAGARRRLGSGLARLCRRPPGGRRRGSPRRGAGACRDDPARARAGRHRRPPPAGRRAPRHRPQYPDPQARQLAAAAMSQDRALQLREATPADLATLAGFACAMARETEARVLDRATVERGIAAVLDDPSRGRYLVAERGGEAVGTLMLTYE